MASDEVTTWLEGLLTERFATFDRSPNSRTLDELYILVGTAKIAGLDDRYDEYRAELVRIRSRVPSAAAPEVAPSPSVSAPPSPRNEDIRDALRRRVRGQDAAIDRVVDRLAVRRAGLSLRPQRPAGVFLFAGPTGVGKTELATQLAIAEFGTVDALIRLDMSEYANREFGLSRLVGSASGYSGHNEPGGWLTTRVIARPRSVLLLDEIEKADPLLWNTFLQVFDAGRLTDGRGQTADFAETTVILTSNLGVRESATRSAGFGEPATTPKMRQLAAIEAALPPELRNRIDEVIVFDPLPLDTIAEIATAEIDALLARISRHGWRVTVDPEVPRWLAETGFHPDLGARHLHRVIERDFLGLLASQQERVVRVALGLDGLIAIPRG